MRGGGYLLDGGPGADRPVAGLRRGALVLGQDDLLPDAGGYRYGTDRQVGVIVLFVKFLPVSNG